MSERVRFNYATAVLRNLWALTFACALAAVSGATAAAPAPAAPSRAEGPVYDLTAEQWREDLRFMAAEMEKRHANLFHKASREQFEAAVADLDARIPTLQRNEIIVGLMRIAAMVGDGHTRIDPRKDMKFGFPSLPLRLYSFEDGLYVRAAAPAQAALVGARIEAIGGVPVAEAIRRASEIASVDNEMGYKLVAPLYLNRPDILHALKLSPRRDAAILTLRKGERSWTATVPAAAIEPRWPDDTDGSFFTPEGWTDARATPQPPLWLQAPLDYHRMVPLPARKALYTQLNMVTGVKGESLAQFGQKIRKEAEATNPRVVILDYRLAFGGNHDLRFAYIPELIRAEDDDTRLIVLTARGSFSATQALLVDLDRYTKAVFIGEPASSKPNSYGDGYRAYLPNSGLAVQSSIYWNQLAAPHNKDPWTFVDVAAPLRFADYVAGRDPALEAALAYETEPPLSERLLDASAKGGLEGLGRAFDAYRSDPANRYRNLRLLVPQAAEMLSDKHPEEAFAVAQIGAEAFPDTVDAFLVLAFMAERTKRPEVALRAARRAMELDPDNRQARSLVERIERGGK